MGTHTDMQLLLSMPAHLAVEAEFVTTTPVDEEGTAETTQADDNNDDDESSTAGVIINLLLLPMIVAAAYFLLIRPRRRMMRQQQTLQKSIEVGDEVLLTSGVYGFITGFEEGTDVVWVEIDDDVQVRVARAAISGKIDTTGGDAGDAAPPESTTSSRPTLKGGTGSSTTNKVNSSDSAESVDE